MTPIAVAAALGLLLGGPAGALAAGSAAWWWARRGIRPAAPPEPRLVMILLLVELRSGVSALAALQSTAKRLSGYESLRRVSRLASVSGLVASISECDDGLRPIVAQLARAQRSGSSLTSAIHRMLEQDLARFRSERLSEARTLPVRLMIPISLLMLPGLVLVLYAPSLIRTFSQLTDGWP